MLYLIESFMRDEQDNPLRCLKIGYAKNIEDRLKAYKTYNPSVKLLKTREGEYDLENYLHKYFKRYELSGYKEWFIYSKKIVDEFDVVEIQSNNDTILLEEYLNYVRKNILYEIIPSVYKKYTSRIPEILVELEKEYDSRIYKENIFSKFPKDLCNRKLIDFLNNAKLSALEYFSILNLSNIKLDIPEIITKDFLAGDSFKNNCWLIYKTSEGVIINDIKTKINFKEKSTKRYLETYKSIELSTVLDKTGIKKAQKEYTDLLKRKIRADKYEKDYLGINNLTFCPIFNELMYLLENRALELIKNDFNS